MRSGVADLKLHYGRAPKWLFNRMVRLGKCILTVIVDEYGQKEVLKRLSNPYWFQALSNTLGYDWDSSGVTTVTCAVLKESLEGMGIEVAGGKGKTSLKTPKQIESIGDKLNLSSKEEERLKYTSKMVAKVDNSAIQDRHSLYHHSIFISEKGDWTVVQQGMNPTERTARRYHWFNSGEFVNEPNDQIAGQKQENVLNMVAKLSEGSRKTCTDLAKEKPEKVRGMFKKIRPKGQASLNRWVKGKSPLKVIKYKVPKRVNWNALEKAYEIQPRDYEKLLAVKGVGPATVRGLALISDLVYGEKASWRDPVKFSYAFGGKDGVPFPVDREKMDKAIKKLEEYIKRSEMGDRDRKNSLKRLKRIFKS